MIGAPIDEERIRYATNSLGLGESVDDILAVWSKFDLMLPSLEIVSLVRAAGTQCHLATNQDSYRAAFMRTLTPYEEILDGTYYSCDIGVAKPSTDFFDYIATDLGLSSSQLLFLDDQASNVVGARSAGLNAEQWTHADGISQLHDILTAHEVLLSREDRIVR